MRVFIVIKVKKILPVTNEADFGGSWERVIRMVSNFILKHENPQEVLYILETPNSVRKDV